MGNYLLEFRTINCFVMYLQNSFHLLFDGNMLKKMSRKLIIKLSGDTV